MTPTTADLAHLVAVKARLDPNDPVLMAGVERAVVEIVYATQRQLMDELLAEARQQGGVDDGKLVLIAYRLGQIYERDNSRVMRTLMAALDDRDGEDGPHRQRPLQHP